LRRSRKRPTQSLGKGRTAHIAAPGRIIHAGVSVSVSSVRRIVRCSTPPYTTRRPLDATVLPASADETRSRLSLHPPESRRHVAVSPGGGKSHLAAALGLALVEKGWRVLFSRTTDVVQKLQIACRDLGLEAAIAKLDKYHLLILDDLAYVTKDQVETRVLFELISARYERRSLLITANQPFGEGGRIFPDPAMTLAAIDRLAHHATILEMNVDSYRRKEAIDTARGVGRPPILATIKASS
jgi:hypothetical protein